jgi:hypothetical protein
MSDPDKLVAPRFFFWVGLLVGCGLLLFLLPRHHYYFLPSAQRPIQPEHEVLRSSGYGGLSFGAIGTLLIFLNLSYLIRKELFHWNWLGHLRSWMSFHVMTGFVALLFVLLHSGFLLRSALGSLALVAFGIVIFTGIIGRYVYAHTPRSLEGSELEMDEVRKRLKEYRAHLEKLGMPQELFKTLLEPPSIAATEIKGLLGSLMGMVTGDRQLRHTYDEVYRVVQKSPTLRPMGREIMPLVLRYYRELQWLSRFHELRGMMSGWRFFHRWLAIVMLSAVLFHIIVAQQMGNLWMFDPHRLQQFWGIAKAAYLHFLDVLRLNLKHVPALQSFLSRFR